MKFISLFVIALPLCFCHPPQHSPVPVTEEKSYVKTGADQTELYLPSLQGKRVAMMANQTTVVGRLHLVDSLKKLGVNIVKVFGPEHGFRGKASAGAVVKDEIDSATGIPAHDPLTLETTLPGLFIAGVVVAGYDANKIFIENGRFHGDQIVARLLGAPAPAAPRLSGELDT